MQVYGLGKRFRRYRAAGPRSLVEYGMSGRRGTHTTEDWFWAFRDVSFEVSAGEMLGIVGRNGAGKSTLLSLMGGLLHADEGFIRLRGRVSALLDLGRSLHPLLSGRENILTSGLLNGLARRQIEQRADAIIAFTEIGEFIDAPVRTYSSGMKARLAFSVAVHADPDILLIDEFLFVGDQCFQEKCLGRIRALQGNGTAVLLSSHIAAKISEHCDRALWLDHCGVRALGRTGAVLQQYETEAGHPAASKR